MATCIFQGGIPVNPFAVRKVHMSSEMCGTYGVELLTNTCTRRAPGVEPISFVLFVWRSSDTSTCMTLFSKGTK